VLSSIGLDFFRIRTKITYGEVSDCTARIGSAGFRSITATMTRIDEYKDEPGAKAAWSVVVIYDNTAAREQAVDFCDQLVKRFWARFEFDVSWWSFSLLQQDTVAMEAAAKAAQADVVVVSSLQEEEFPTSIKTWIQSWASRRGDREGVFAGLLGPARPESGKQAKHYYLRQVAHGTAMDYLTQVPQSISRSIPESLDFYTQRAAQVTHVLDEILHRPAVPPALT
jgi:hypothetical protein